MEVTQNSPRSNMHVAPSLRFAWDLFSERMINLGYRTVGDQAKAVGLSRGHLHRLRDPDQQVRLSIDRARHIARLIGVSTDDLFPVASRKAA